jgi:hypothetical protein
VSRCHSTVAAGSHSRGFTLLEVILAVGLSVLVLIAVAMAVDIHLRLVDSNRTGVEEAQLARALLNRMADELRGTVLYNPVDMSKMIGNVSPQGGGSGGAGGGGNASGGTSGGGGASGGTTGGGNSSGGGTGGGNASGGGNTGGNSGGGNTSGGTSGGGSRSGGTTGGGGNTGGSTGGGSTGGSTGGGGSTTQTTSMSGSTGGSTTDTSAGSTGPQSVPGLFGTATEIQIDTSRLPRIDELQAMVATEGSEVPTVTGDMKTVTYYMLGDQSYGAANPVGTSQGKHGLVRLEFDRAAAAWAAQQGQLVGMDENAEPIAPEVAFIQFSYFDGTEWVDEWDSTERGGLPVAVEIAIGIIPARHRDDPQWSSLQTTTSLSLADTTDLLVYHTLVYLPAAQPTTATGTSTASGATSGGSAGGSTGAGSGGSIGGSL